jgi:hypothetical protein
MIWIRSNVFALVGASLIRLWVGDFLRIAEVLGLPIIKSNIIKLTIQCFQITHFNLKN